MPTHSIEKTAKADSEKLPDINGTKITYAGGVECQVTVMERSGSQPTVTAGASVSAGGYSGVCEQQTTKILPQYKLDGAIVWETTTVMATEGNSV